MASDRSQARVGRRQRLRHTLRPSAELEIAGPIQLRVPRTGSREPCRVHWDGTSGCTLIGFGASTSPALIAVIASSERPSLRKLARQPLKRWQEWRPPRYRAVAIFYRELGEERFRVVGEGRRRANRRRTPGLAHGH